MKKNYLRVFALLLCGLLSRTQAQEIAIMEHEEISFLSEAVSIQKKGIIAGLDSLKRQSEMELRNMDSDSLIAYRMRHIQETIPLIYNEKIKYFLEKYISQNYNPYMSKLQGLAQYYFPIFEPILAQNNLPDEVKYLSVVESSLDPHLVSTSGAVGLWQFMYATAKGYNIVMDNQLDERKDPHVASHAASQYFLEAYAEFDDWLLALASYNCGRGAVRRAIQRSGLVKPDYWALSPFLPQETQNYIPKFIAMTYAFKYAKEYGIGQASVGLDWDSKTIMLDKNVDLREVAKAVDLSLEELKRFNPAYKSTVIYASVEKPRRLVLPQTQNINDSLLYAALNNTGVTSSASYAAKATSSSTGNSTATRHKVRQGESLALLAGKYGVTVQNLKAWNNLTSKSRLLGRTLVVKSEEQKRIAQVPKKTSTASGGFQSYTVRKGDTLSAIANRFKGVDVNKLKADNGLKSATLQIGQKLKIRTL